MISPTDKGIRVDSEGDGHYGSSRGNRRHNGEDWLCDVGQQIVAPFNMFIERISYPNGDKIMSGIAWKSGRSTGRMWYFEPYDYLIGANAFEGMPIGVAQNVSEYYGLPKMKNHIHLRVDK